MKVRNNMNKRQRTTYTKEFKLQMVELYNSGKPASEITAEYDLSPASIHNWVRAYRKTGSVQVESNLTLEQKELIASRKRIKQLEMENDILKQAALIMGRK